MTDDSTPINPPSETDDFMAQARDRYTEAMDADSEDRQFGQQDATMISGDQWNVTSKQMREQLKMPCLTWNREHSFVQQVVNNGRHNKPAVHVTPGDGGDLKTAQELQSRIRQIEYESNADTVRDMAREQQVGTARGFYRITTAWAPSPSWKQIIKFEPISNQFSVVYDPFSVEYTRCDAQYLFIDSVLSINGYRQKFGKDTPLAQTNFFEGSADIPCPNWLRLGPKMNGVRVAEYWVKEATEREEYLLLNGDSMYADEAPAGFNHEQIANSRTVLDWCIYQYLIDGFSILKKTKWLGKNFPIIPYWGRQEVVSGRRRNVSLVRFAHDAQKLVNLYVSNIAFHINQSPKSPYIGYEGTFDGHEDEWANANNIPLGYLQAKPVIGPNGQLLPLPMAIQSEPPIQALALGLSQAIDQLKAACGIYNTELGNAPSDASGLAIQRSNSQSDMSNFHFSDNEVRSTKYAGVVLLELIKALDAGADQIDVRDFDGKTRKVKLNQPTTHTDGSTVVHNLAKGNYEPHIISGPSYTSARQETYNICQTLASQDPNFMRIGGDIMFRSMDMVGSDVLADRYHALLDPKLQKPGDPGVMMQQLQQAQAMIQELTQHLHQSSQALEAKLPDVMAKVKIAEETEKTKRMQIYVNAKLQEAALGVQSAIAQLENETSSIQHSVEMASNKDTADFEALLDHHLQLGDALDQQQQEQEKASTDGTAQ